MLLQAKNATVDIGALSTEQKNNVLRSLAKNLVKNTDTILVANEKDIAEAKRRGLGPKIDRLRLTEERITAIAADIQNVITLPDPVGEVLESTLRPNQLHISRVRSPLGLVGIIYESRPNVTVDAFVLAFKAGNAVALKGGSDAINSNAALVAVIQNTLTQHNVTKDALCFFNTTDRKAASALLQARGLVDVVIPRGGKNLIDLVVSNSTVPVIETGASVVHIYVDPSADLDQATNIAINAKTRRVSVCNALDTLLVHQDVLDDFLTKLNSKLTEACKSGVPEVTIHADKASHSVLSKLSYKPLEIASESDYSTEWLDYTLNVKSVENPQSAFDHIRQYSLGHSECVCATDSKVIEQFLNTIDAACLYVNSSTAFSDGAEFGLGAEIGISTQKLHARGPFALEGLTTYKWVIKGDGQIRPL